VAAASKPAERLESREIDDIIVLKLLAKSKENKNSLTQKKKALVSNTRAFPGFTPVRNLLVQI